MIKRCQIPGCNAKAVNGDKGSGIYRGHNLCWAFHYCEDHDLYEVHQARDAYIDTLVNKDVQINPFLAVKRARFCM